MSAQTTRPAELEELNRIRLDEDLTFRELETLLDGEISHATLQRLLTDPDAVCYDRTQKKIRDFLERRRASARRCRARR